MFTDSFGQSNTDLVQSLSQEIENSKTSDENKIILLVYSELNWIGDIQDGNYVSHQIKGNGDKKYSISCGETNVVTVLINPVSTKGTMDIYLIKGGQILKNQFISTPGETFESSIDCLASGKFQVHDSEPLEKFDYFLVGSSVVGVIIIMMIIKNRFFIKQDGPSSSNNL